MPAEPDVPDVPDADLDDDDPAAFFDEDTEPMPGLDGPELTRIASRLRRQEAKPPPLPDEIDIAAVLAAARNVPGVANAALRANPGGVHTLRLDLSEGADPGRVSRQVARLLKERMGLAAEPRRPRADPVAPPPAAGEIAEREVRMPPAGPYPFGRPAALGEVSEPTTPPPREPARPEPAPRVVVDQVRVSTLGTEATVEVRLQSNGVPSVGAASGPAVDAYLLRLAAQAAANAIDGLIEASPSAPPLRCFIDHAGVVPFGSCVVAVVVVLVSGEGWVEQLVGSALVSSDPRQAIVRATLAAMNRRLESLLA